MFFRTSNKEVSFKSSPNRKENDSGNLLSSIITGSSSIYLILSNTSIFSPGFKDISFISRSEGSSNAILIVFAPAVAFIIRHISVKLMTSVILRWSFFSATKVPFPDLRSRYPNSDNPASAFRTVTLLTW